MPQTIIDDNGNEIEVFTAEELAQKANEASQELEERYKKELEEKDKYVKEKLDQFQKAKNNVDTAQEEVAKKAEEASLLAQELKAKIEETEKTKNETVKNFWIQQTTGGDSELVKKLNEAYDLINVEIKTEADIATRVSLASKMVGINSIEMSAPNFMGGVAPNFAGSDAKQAQGYDQFKQDLGL
jgi:small-conductance mechanosensitive channel